MLGPLELELEMVSESICGVLGTKPKSCKSSECTSSLSPLSSPKDLYLYLYSEVMSVSTSQGYFGDHTSKYVQTT